MEKEKKAKFSGLVESIADFFVNRPKTILMVGLIILFSLMAGLPKLSADFTYRVWFKDNNEWLKRFDAFERRFGSDETLVLVLHSPSGVFDLETGEMIRELTRDLWKIPTVIRVTSLANHSWVHSKNDDIMVEPLLPEQGPLNQSVLDERKVVALKDEQVPGYLVSKDGKTAMFYANLKPSLSQSPDYHVAVTSIQDILKKKYEGKGDHQFHLTGNPVINSAFQDSAQRDIQLLFPIVILITIVSLWFTFKSAGGVALSLLTVFTSILATLGLAGWLGFKISTTTALLPQILIAVGVAESVHVLVTYFANLSAGMNRKDALRASVAKNYTPTVFTSITTTAGFISFASAEVAPIMHLGVLAGAGALIAWSNTFLILVPLVRLLPVGKPKAKIEDDEMGAASPVALRITEWIHKFRYAIVIIFISLTALSTWLAAKNEVNSDPFKYFAKDYPLVVATDFIEEHVGSAVGPEVVLSSGQPEGAKDPAFLRKVEEFQNWVGALPSVTKTVSLIDILKATNRSLHGDEQRYYSIPEQKEAVAQLLFLYTMSLPQGLDINDRITLDNDAVRLSVLWKLHDSITVMKNIYDIEAKAKEMGLDAKVTGKVPLWQSMNGYVVQSFVDSIFSSTLMIGALMVFALMSFHLGLISMIPNIVPLVFGAAALKLLGKPLDIGTVLVASVCLGIAVDDTIHVMVNYRKLTKQGKTVSEAFAQIFTHTAKALTVTTLVLVASFGVFAFGSFIPNVNFGIMTALILSIALLTDLFLTPSLLMILEDWKARRSEAKSSIPVTVAVQSES